MKLPKLVCVRVTCPECGEEYTFQVDRVTRDLVTGIACPECDHEPEGLEELIGDACLNAMAEASDRMVDEQTERKWFGE